MSINMANVKQIMHGAKEVIKIQDSNGGILWQKPSSSTITININKKLNENSSYLYVAISINGVATNYTDTTTMTVNKSELDYIRVYHKAYLPTSEGYTIVFDNGSVADTNETSTFEYYDIDISNINSLVDIDLAYYKFYPTVAWIVRDNATITGTRIVWKGSGTGTSTGSGYGNAFYTLDGTAQSQTTLTTTTKTSSFTLTYTCGTSRGSTAYPGVLYSQGDATTSLTTYTYYKRWNITNRTSLKYIVAKGHSNNSSSSTPVSKYGSIYLIAF